MNNILNPKITMLTTRSSDHIAGRVVLNGQEWVVKPFEIAKGEVLGIKKTHCLNRRLRSMGNE